MRTCLFITVFFISVSLNAQKKLSFDLNASILKSVGRDIFKNYNSSINPLTITYYSRRKFIHPYLNVLGQIEYKISPGFAAGIQSGIYLHYLEKYFSNAERTTISIPVMLTVRHAILKIKSKPLGVEVGAGGIFFTVDDSQFKTINGKVYNASFYYHITPKSILKLGIEKEKDNVWFYFKPDEQPTYQNETYRYPMNRLALILAYKYLLRKN
jgi:hypothetical protein